MHKNSSYFNILSYLLAKVMIFLSIVKMSVVVLYKRLKLSQNSVYIIIKFQRHISPFIAYQASLMSQLLITFHNKVRLKK